VPGRMLYKLFTNKARASVNSMVSHSLTALTENSRATPVPDYSGLISYNFDSLNKYSYCGKIVRGTSN